MTLEAAYLAVTAVLYLVVLLGVAEATERGGVPLRWVKHPVTFALSLGAFATSWTLYGSVGFAQRDGYDFLAIYLGPTLACLLIPTVWRPVLRLARTLQLSSPADLVAYRYQSRFAGGLVTVFLVLGTLPYMALQIRAVAEAGAYLAPGTSPRAIGLGFSALVLLFAVTFGLRQQRLREPRPGLVAAIAVESVVKLTALLTVAAVAYFDVLGGASGVQDFLQENPEALAQLFSPVREAPWTTTLLLAGSAAFLLPRQFHLAFAERPSERALLHATWLFPAFLLVLNLGIVPTLWAGARIAPELPPDLYVLAVARRYPLVTSLAFIGGFSAASAMVIVSAVALSGMVLNHLVTPFLRPRGDVYAQLTRARRVALTLLVAAGFLAYVALAPTGGLAQLGLVSFVAVAQLLPAMVGVLLWPRATRRGVILGLSAGVTLWFVLLVLPSLGAPGPLQALLDVAAGIDASWQNRWVASTAATLLVNGGLFGLVSLFTRASPEEQEAAAVCNRDLLATAPLVGFETVADLESRMAEVLGSGVARAEILQALEELGLDEDEDQQDNLRRLAERLERNLTGLLGPLPARAVLRRSATLEPTRSLMSEQVRLLEAQIQETRLSGAAARVDTARRYLREVLERLPTGVCVLDVDGRVVMWNERLRQMSGHTAEACLGRRVSELPGPWGQVLTEAAIAVPDQAEEHPVESDGRPLELRTIRTDVRGEDEPEGVVLVVEDLTERRAFERRVAHRDRLASVGQLAAGVAHEIGNPLTGIKMVASNLRREAPSADAEARLGLLISEAERIQGIVRNLVDFSRDGERGGSFEVNLKPLRVDEVLEETVGLLELSRRHHEVRVVHDALRGIEVLGDRQRLIQVFLNLLANACDASEPGAEVHLQASRVADDEVRIDVIDQGTGMTPDARERLFEPFFTTKAVGEGTGLGLAVVFSIVRAHGGRIEVDSEIGRGTRMQVFLQSAEAQTP